MAALTIEFPQTAWTVEFGGDEIVVAEVTMTGGTGGGFDGVHNDLDGRSTADAHPISAITGLTAALEAGGASALADLTDVDVETDPPAPDDVLAWDGTNWTPATLDGGAGGGGGPDLSNDDPADLGTADSGASADASRADHVHDMPTAADVGADADGAAQAVADSLGGAAVLDVGTTAGTVAAGDDSRLSDARTPVSHSHAASEVTSGTLDIARIPTGTTSTTAALGNHDHSGVYQPADSNLTTIAGLTATTDSFMQAKAGAWAARTIAQVKTDLGVIEKLPRTSGEYYTLGGAEASSPIAGQAGSGAAGRMVAHPVWLPAGSYDRACVRTTVAAVATYRIGVYPNNAATMRPDGTTLILDCGTIDMNATAGLLSTTVTLSIPTSGIYWLAILMDSYTAAPSAFGWNGNPGVTPNLPYLGHRSISSAGGRGTWGASKTGVTTGSMPGTFPTSTLATDIMPQILVRAT